MPIKGKKNGPKNKKEIKMNMEEYLRKEADTIIENFTLACLSRVDNCKSRARIGESKIHGKGIFANCDIKKGEIITYYPAHFVLLKPNGYNFVDGKIQVINVTSCFSQGRDVNHNYSFVINENLSICGDPESIDNPDFLAHMANDGMIVTSCLFGQKQSDLYEKLSLVKNNSVIEISDSSCIFLRATNDIKEGDEITTPYGYHYWVRENLMKNMVDK